VRLIDVEVGQGIAACRRLQRVVGEDVVVVSRYLNIAEPVVTRASGAAAWMPAATFPWKRW